MATALDMRAGRTESRLSAFAWDDPFLLEEQLTDDERLIRDSARGFAQDKLMPRILEANRHELVDRDIFNEFGKLGFLGCTIEG